jgi:hypothetical protein
MRRLVYILKLLSVFLFTSAFIILFDLSCENSLKIWYRSKNIQLFYNIYNPDKTYSTIIMYIQSDCQSSYSTGANTQKYYRKLKI